VPRSFDESVLVHESGRLASWHDHSGRAR
jgi:hypothetical protein